jgi:hypothetical protein
MIARVALSLHVLKIATHAIVILPVLLTTHVATRHLPSTLSFLGTDGPMILPDLVEHRSGLAVTAVLWALAMLLVAPLVTAGTVRSLGVGASPGPVGILLLGLPIFPRFLLVNIVYLVAGAAGCVALVLCLPPLSAAFGSLALLVVLTGLRDVAQAGLRHPVPLARAIRRIGAVVRRRPLSLAGWFLAQAALGWLLLALALQVQAHLHGEGLVRALTVPLLVQVALLARTGVRCAWYRALTRRDS